MTCASDYESASAVVYRGNKYRVEFGYRIYHEVPPADLEAFSCSGETERWFPRWIQRDMMLTREIGELRSKGLEIYGTDSKLERTVRIDDELAA